MRAQREFTAWERHCVRLTMQPWLHGHRRRHVLTVRGHSVKERHGLGSVLDLPVGLDFGGINNACTCDPGYTGSNCANCMACTAGSSKAVSGNSACAPYTCPGNQFSSEGAANTAAVCWAYPSCAVSVAASTAPTACQCQACTYEDTQVLNPSYAQRSYSSMWADRDFFSLLDDLHSSLSWAALTNTPGGEWMEIDAGTYCRSHHTGTRWLMVNSMGQRIQIGTSTRQYRGI